MREVFRQNFFACSDLGSNELKKAGGRRQESGDRMKKTPAKSFQDLIVWQKAHQSVLSVYRFSNQFPNKETYGLTSQLRRAEISVPANIADSCLLASEGRD